MDNELKQGMMFKSEAIDEVRKGCMQFAMLYFHFVKTLVDKFGIDEAKMLTQKAIFELAVERSDYLRSRAKELGLEFTPETMMEVSDIPLLGWDASRKINHCPYAERWMKYYSDYSWFKEFAHFYCDIIDTTNCENFTKDTSHKIIKNVLLGDEVCERIYYKSDEVKKGIFSYSIDLK